MRIIADVGGTILEGRETPDGVWVYRPSEFAEFVQEVDIPSTIVILGGTKLLQTVPTPEKESDRQHIFIWLVNRYSDDYLGGERIKEIYVSDKNKDSTDIEDDENDAQNSIERIVY